MSSIDLPEANVEAVAGLHDRPGVLIYEYTPQVTDVVEYGASADAVLSGQASPPAEGARFDLYLEGPVKGPKLGGTVKGVDYLGSAPMAAPSSTYMPRSPPKTARRLRWMRAVWRFRRNRRPSFVSTSTSS